MLILKLFLRLKWNELSEWWCNGAWMPFLLFTFPLLIAIPLTIFIVPTKGDMAIFGPRLMGFYLLNLIVEFLCFGLFFVSQWIFNKIKDNWKKAIQLNKEIIDLKNYICGTCGSELNYIIHASYLEARCNKCNKNVYDKKKK